MTITTEQRVDAIDAVLDYAKGDFFTRIDKAGIAGGGDWATETARIFAEKLAPDRAATLLVCAIMRMSLAEGPSK